MKKTLFKIISPLLVLLVVLLAAAPITALAADAVSSGIGFYVRAVIPENQIDDSLSYFDLRMNPGQQQTLEIEIVNEGDETLTLSLDAISASTNRNGVIDYKTPGVQDESLATPFSGLAALEEDAIQVAPHSTRTVRFTVDMPQDSYDGVILGGILLTKENAEAPTAVAAGEGSGGGAAIQNIYSYVIGVKLTETDAPVAPDFELVSAEAGVVNYDAAVVHGIRNKEAVIVKGITLDVEVYRDGQAEPVASYQKSDVDMAPNSLMELGVGLAQNADGSAGALEPGDYTSNVTLTYGGETWNFTKTFRVGQETVDAVNDQTVPTTAPAQAGGFPLWIILVVAGLLLVILLLLVLLLRRRKEEEENRG